MIEKINVNEMSPEQLKQIEAQIKEHKKAAKEKRRSNIEVYKSLEDEFVCKCFPLLKELSDNLVKRKEEVYSSAELLINMKRDVYNLISDTDKIPSSRTFSNSDGTQKIEIGINDKDGWDMDICGEGIKRVHNWIDKRASDGDNILISFVREYLRTDSKGAFDRGRIADMITKANDYDESELRDAAELILEGYRPAKTSSFIRGEYKDVYGVTRRLKLTMTN